MAEQDFSLQDLRDLCIRGDLEGMRKWLENTLPTLPAETQKSFCAHIHDHCDDIPCTASITTLSIAAAEGNRTAIFAYLWDRYLAPHGVQAIPWPCLKTAAFQGNIALAEVFWCRDPDCFRRNQPPGVRGPPNISDQFKIAIRRDRYDYIDFMLAHGADINAGLPEIDLLKTVVRCAVDDQETVRRINFLVSRGARVRDSAALCAAVDGGSVELTTCLLDHGADVNMSQPGGTPPLMLAAAQGYDDVVMLLLKHGADVDSVDVNSCNLIEAAVQRAPQRSVADILEAREVQESPLPIKKHV